MAHNDVTIRFQDVNFAYSRKVLLDDASFSVRADSRVALMGQNGAGKSTMFKLITGELKPDHGQVSVTPKEATIATARQVMNVKYLDMTVRDFFQDAFSQTLYHLDKLIADVLEVVNLDIDIEKKVRDFSGGQQARLLLAHALIQNPEILLLDEPTNNLDQEGIDHLTTFLIMYPKTCIVISHDAEFLNAFTDGVLYLDSFTHKVEQYSGNYNDVVEEIAARVRKEQLLNVRAEKDIKRLKAQAGVFAHKGGKLRSVAKRMREAAQEAEESKVEVRREDATIRPFTIPVQTFDSSFDGKIATIHSVSVVKNGKPVTKKLDLAVRRDTHVLVSGPNGIGKSTFLKSLVSGHLSGTFADGLSVGDYRQDFSNLAGEQKAYDCLWEVMELKSDEALRATASRFLLNGPALDQTVNELSEGQKGLLSFARLVLQKPGLLILDEPTNHINFRHLPVIASCLDEYKGAMILVSHYVDFVKKIRIDEEIDLSKI
ncbi:MAG: ABC-F family ATP-binding cassette domain-containing protein [Parcubacteria group bacterium]|nr:ABC-F family ATP-binding cassette domain-containing protein [Parcubacteria group bacterium]